MKPFDFDKARAGAPVVLKNTGEVLSDIAFLTLINPSEPCVFAAHNGFAYAWDIVGKPKPSAVPANLGDLAMQSKTVVKYVNFYDNGECRYYDSVRDAHWYSNKVYDSYGMSFTATAIAVPVEFEMGYGTDE